MCNVHWWLFVMLNAAAAFPSNILNDVSIFCAIFFALSLSVVSVCCFAHETREHRENHPKQRKCLSLLWEEFLITSTFFVHHLLAASLLMVLHLHFCWCCWFFFFWFFVVQIHFANRIEIFFSFILYLTIRFCYRHVVRCLLSIMSVNQCVCVCVSFQHSSFSIEKLLRRRRVPCEKRVSFSLPIRNGRFIEHELIGLHRVAVGCCGKRSFSRFEWGIFIFRMANAFSHISLTKLDITHWKWWRLQDRL